MSPDLVIGVIGAVVGTIATIVMQNDAEARKKAGYGTYVSRRAWVLFGITGALLLTALLIAVATGTLIPSEAR